MKTIRVLLASVLFLASLDAQVIAGRATLAGRATISRAAASTPITLGNHGQAVSFPSGSIDTTGSNFLAVCLAGDNYGSGPTVTDSKSNTWNARTAPVFSGLYFAQLWYVTNPTVGTGHTFSVTGAGNVVMMYAGFNNVKTTAPFDLEPSGGGTSGSGTQTRQPGSITPSENNELALTCLMGDTSNTSTVDGGFTAFETRVTTGGVNFAGGFAYLVQTTATAFNPTWDTGSGGSAYSVSSAAFKAP